MIYYCEINKTDAEHAVVNKALLRMLMTAFPQENIQGYLSPSHLDALKMRHHKDPRLNFETIPVLSPIAGNKRQWLNKLSKEIIQLVRLYFQFKKSESFLLLFTSLSPTAFGVLSILSRLFPTKGKVVVTLHGELQLLAGKPSKIIDRLYARCIRYGLLHPGKSLTYLVLGDTVREKLLEERLAHSATIWSLPHPLREPLPIKAASSDPPLVFGHIGVAKQAKQSAVFFEWASRCAAAIEQKKIQFVLAGPVLPDMQGYTNQWVEHRASEHFLSDEDFQRICSRMDYAIFLYEESQYGFISSGALTEAISFEIPILAIRNKQLEHLFSQVETPPGRLYTTKEAMWEDLRSLIEQGTPDLKMREGIRQLKALYSLPQMAAKFRLAIENKSHV
jgi:hypothetical protein